MCIRDRALGAALDGQRGEPAGHEEPAMSATTILDEAFTALIALSLTVVAACRLTGRSRASHYRRVNPPPAKAAPVPQAERTKPPSTLSAKERANVLAAINSEQYSA